MSPLRRWWLITLLVVRVPLYAIVFYALYRVAVGSRTGAFIVAAFFLAWLMGSLIWAYVILPWLKKRRRRNSY